MFLLVLFWVMLMLAIASLLWYRAKAEREWLIELLDLSRQPTQPSATADHIEQPIRANITPERERRQVQLHHQNLHDTLYQQLKEQHEQQSKRKRKKNQSENQAILFPEENNQNSDNNETANAPSPTVEPNIISLDEATRLLHANKTPHRELETVVLNWPSSRNTAHRPIAEEITVDDPAVRHVLRRQQQNESPSSRSKTPKRRTRETIELPPAPAAKPAASGSPSAHHTSTHTINDDDIRSHLMRQRFAGRRNQKPIVPAENASVLPVIAEDEVRANLAKTDAPASRDPQHLARPTVRESIIPAAARVGLATPISTRFTPYEHPHNDTGHLKPAANPSPTPTSSHIKTTAFDSLKTTSNKTPNPTSHEAPLTWELLQATPAETSDNTPHKTAFRADPSLTEQVSTDIPHIELGDDSEWQQTLAEQSTPPEPRPISATPVAPSAATRMTVPELPTLPTRPTAAPAAHTPSGYLKPLEYALPMAQLLAPPEYNPQATMSEETLIENGITIEEKLAEFRVKVKVVDANAGPVITRYEIEPDVGVRGSSVINLEKDLARSLGVAAIRVVETIPGKTCMGLELPNPKRQTIRLSEIFQSPEFEQSPSKITLALGQDITGRPVVTDLKKAPHLLVAGTTGSGKSVGVNAMILSMLFKASPQDVRLIMIDPKMLELSIYEGIPHLLAPVVTDMKLAANALTWCVNEMEKRYRLMSYVGVRNLESYNQKIQDAAAQGRSIANPFSYTPDDPEPLEKLPFIIVVVDEFADLMMVAGKQIEQLIARLAQKARAAGIHLILATQRPSVDVITGLIKANIPTRIAFQVSSKIDSRTILDQMGAENLLGQGDMLFLPPGTAYPQRVHGAFVADEEVHRIVQYLKRFGEPDYIDDILTAGTGSDDLFSNANSGYGNNDRDPQFDEAVAFILRSQKVTISSIQRHLRIGYNKAADIVEQMQAEGIVSAPDANGKRSILARGGNHDD